jgi:diguanylate cyclase (GGDEF)-like protein
VSEHEPAEGIGNGGDVVLVVEDDRFLSRLLEVELGSAGFVVRTARDGREALDAALADPPDLILADVMMPRMDGFELTRQLRADPRTEDVNIIMVTARGLSADKLTGLTAGADDYIVKPFDNEELLARIRGVLRRSREQRSRSPLTGLPGNVRIEEEIQQRIESREPFALLYADLDNFKAYSDRYGFVRGDELLKAVGAMIQEVARDLGGPGAFVGHIGGDDFVVVTALDLGVQVAEAVARRFDGAAASFYEPDDARAGYIEGEDRQGRRQRFPLMSISIGIVPAPAGRFGHRAQAVALATEMKEHAKRTPGSSVALDRRAT